MLSTGSMQSRCSRQWQTCSPACWNASAPQTASAQMQMGRRSPAAAWMLQVLLVSRAGCWLHSQSLAIGLQPARSLQTRSC